MSTELDRRAFLAHTAALSGSSILVGGDSINTARAAVNKRTNESKFKVKC